MCVQWGGDSVHPSTPRRDVAARRALLPSWRWGGCALLWSDGGSGEFPSSFPAQAHLCSLPIPPALVPVAVPTRGCAREAAPLLLPHHELMQNPVGCAAVPPLTQLTCTEWGSSCLGSPAHRCYPLMSVIFPNFYIYIYVFVNFQENWGQTYFLL